MLPVGYFPCTQDPPHGDNVAGLIEELVEQAETCEQAGFDGFFFTEHHQQEDGYLPSPVLMAGMIGMRTRASRSAPACCLRPCTTRSGWPRTSPWSIRPPAGRMVAAVGYRLPAA